jgi:HAD superfamily hydrolase (TIGR01509 family)
MKELAAVIFDCDGVMFESKQANLAFYNRIFTRFGYPPVQLDDEVRAQICHTASSTDVLSSLMNEDDLDAAFAFAATLDYCEFIPEMKPSNNLQKVLQLLDEKFPLAVATNRGSSIGPVLDYFNLKAYFDVVVSSNDVANAKPAPDMLLMAAQKLKVQPRHCLFIGDSKLDMQAAQEAQMPFVGYGNVLRKETVSLLDLNEIFDYLQY